MVRAAVEAAEIGIWSYDLASGVVLWSAEVERLYGIAPGSFGGTVAAYLELQLPDVRQYLESAMQAAFAERSKKFELRHWIRPQDGSPDRFSVCWGTVVLDDDGQPIGMRGALTDRTAQKLSEDSLATRERTLKLVADLSSDYVYEADARRPHLFPEIVAGSFERTTGYSKEEIEAKGGWFAVIHPQDLADLVEHTRDLSQGAPIVAEYRLICADGSIRWLRDRISPVIEAGELVRLVGGVQDITEQRALSERLKQAQKLEALARLSGSVAHDFNNLLTVMMAAADAIADPLVTERDRKECLSDLNEALSRAANLTSSLLTFGRRQVTLLQSLDLEGILKGSATMMQRAAGEGTEVVVRAEDLNVHIRGDRGQLELLVLNLVMNARDAAPRDHKVVIITRKTHLASSDAARPAELPPGEYAEICVQDAGSGMDVATQARVFEPFFTTKEVGRGTGLGLSTVHGIVRSWGGALRVISQEGQGTTMRVFFPLALADGQSESQAQVRAPTVGGTECILLVDDDPLVAKAARRSLSEHGYKTRIFASAEELLCAPSNDVLEAQMLISDVRLPGIDGIELSDQMRAQFPHLRVLLISGFVEHEKQQAILTSGRYGFLPKPFSAEGLIRRVREVLDNE